MDPRITDSSRERSRRSIRSKRYNRRNFSEEKRPPKRLFTPEIKRFLKDWLIRRRDNPYPNRDEKKSLAIQTGLTYIQVCNWFANWRRKLKNSGREPQRKSWGYLIKSYNSQVHGNVEHFSICSEDSIWQEPEANESAKYDVDALVSEMNGVNVSNVLLNNHKSYGSINQNNNNNNNNIKTQYCLRITAEDKKDCTQFSQNANKYKNHIIEKYLRDCQKPEDYVNNITQIGTIETDETNKPSMISKWLESAANFRPNENNYLNWTFGKDQKKKCRKMMRIEVGLAQQHGREELDAAEALTRLANANSTLKA